MVTLRKRSLSEDDFVRWGVSDKSRIELVLAKFDVWQLIFWHRRLEGESVK